MRRLGRPPLFPYRDVPGGSSALRIHRAWNRYRWQRTRGAREKLALVAEAALWGPQAVVLTLHGARSWGSSVRERSGKGLARQALEQLSLALRRGIPPLSYYYFRLWDDAKGAHAEEYLHRFEMKPRGIYKHLNRTIGNKDRSLEDKRIFRDRCVASGLPTAPVLLHIENGEVGIVGAKRPSLPPVDLIVKPRTGRGGTGIERWEFDGSGFVSHDGAALSPDALLERLREVSRERPVLVQRRLVNHPEIADLTQRALSTARVMSCLDENGDYEPVIAVFRMAVGTGAVDNIHAGGIASPVDLSSGKLGPATALDPRSSWHTSHPATGAPIAGRELPCWPDVVDLVVRAHRAFPESVVVGWDVGITEDGPCLVEGNSGPCVNLIQRPHDAPLGSHRFGELLAHHLDRARALTRAA